MPTNNALTTYQDYLDTPLGLLSIVANDEGLAQVIFVEERTVASAANAITDAAKQQLAEYFAGERRTFRLPLSAKGTDFQQSVWRALMQVDYGQTASYGKIAQHLNNPKAVRAVGAANGKNPISIIVPCHRVIGANGTLTGYAGGLSRKQWLLEHEEKHHA